MFCSNNVKKNISEEFTDNLSVFLTVSEQKKQETTC